MNTSEKFRIKKFNYFDEVVKTLRFNDDFFKGYEKTIKRSLISNKHSALLFMFPFIERMIRYIMCYFPDFDIEVYNQGKYRTMNSMLDLNREKLTDVIGENTFTQLENLYYGDESLRNISCHTSNKETYLMLEMNLTKYVLLRLIKIIENLDKKSIISLVEEVK